MTANRRPTMPRRRSVGARLAVAIGATAVIVACGSSSSSSPANTSGDAPHTTATAPAVRCGRWLPTAEIPAGIAIATDGPALLQRLEQFLKVSPVPPTEIRQFSTGNRIVIELKRELHACEFATVIEQHFPADPVFVTVWPPASLADAGQVFFGSWTLSAVHGDRLALELRTDGSFLMNDRCNSTVGRWHVNESGSIEFKDIGKTLMACTDRSDRLGFPSARSATPAAISWCSSTATNH